MQVISQLPGIFYRRSSPESSPFVEEGQHVEPTTVVGLVEVMKSFYEVKSGVAGVLLHFVTGDGEVVDVGQPIAEVETDA